MTGERVPFGLQLGKRFGDTIPFAGYGCLDLNRSSRVKKIKSVSGARQGKGTGAVQGQTGKSLERIPTV